MKRRWSAWGSIATGALAVLALAITLFVAHRALTEASDVLVHGEADALVSTLVAELVEDDPLNPQTIERVLHAHEAQGLRYLAVAERDFHSNGKPKFEASEADPKIVVQAGTSQLRGFHPPPNITIIGQDGLGRTGKVVAKDNRVRATGILVAPVRKMQKIVMGAQPSAAGSAPSLPPLANHEDFHVAIDIKQSENINGNGRSIEKTVALKQVGPPWMFSPLIIEFEPPVTVTLRKHFSRLIIVASVAGLVLLAFAIAWSRSALRLATIEQKAAREQRLVALGSMSSVMAHEIRNPLASLKGHAQLLLEEELGERQKKKVERVVAEAERLEALTTNLLDFVRDGAIERVPIGTSDLVERVLHDLPRDRVKVDLAQAPKELIVDGGRIARAVHNLVDNALEASGDLPVDVRITDQKNAVVIEVQDRGPGIPADRQIFEPFVTTRVRGTGLGLSIARRIAEQHDGTLTGANADAGGAVFRMTLPY